MIEQFTFVFKVIDAKQSGRELVKFSPERRKKREMRCSNFRQGLLDEVVESKRMENH